MIIVTGRVSKSGPITKKDGELSVNKDGETIIGLEIGGAKGLFVFPDKSLTDSLPAVGERVSVSVVREYWKQSDGSYGERFTATDWQAA